jgi:hypothetical protein
MKRNPLALGWTLGLSAAVLAFAASPCWAANVPVGSLITGTASGAASSLLGSDGGFAPGSNVTALQDIDLEFLTDDFAVGIDFFSSGLVRIYDNTGTGLLSGTYTLTFDFAALPASFTSFTLADLSALNGGSVSAAFGSSSVQLTLNNVAFATAFDSFTAQIGTAAAVPEPGSLVLTAAALALLAAGRRRVAQGACA